MTRAQIEATLRDISDRLSRGEDVAFNDLTQNWWFHLDPPRAASDPQGHNWCGGVAAGCATCARFAEAS